MYIYTQLAFHGHLVLLQFWNEFLIYGKILLMLRYDAGRFACFSRGDKRAHLMDLS